MSVRFAKFASGDIASVSDSSSFVVLKIIIIIHRGNGYTRTHTHTHTAGQMSESTPCCRRIFWSSPPPPTFAFLYAASCVVVPHKRRAAKTPPSPYVGTYYNMTWCIHHVYRVIADIKIL